VNRIISRVIRRFGIDKANPSTNFADQLIFYNRTQLLEYVVQKMIL